MKCLELKENLKTLFEANGIDDFADIDWIMVEVLETQRSMLPFYGEVSTEKEELIMQVYYRALQGFDVVAAAPQHHVPLSSRLFYMVYNLGNRMKTKMRQALRHRY